VHFKLILQGAEVSQAKWKCLQRPLKLSESGGGNVVPTNYHMQVKIFNVQGTVKDQRHEVNIS